MEYSINIKDILNIARRNMKVVAIFAIVFALLAGAYVMMKDRGSAPSKEQLQKIESDSATYAEYNVKMPEVKEDLQKKLVKAYDVINSHPVMKMDPQKVKYINLTYTLSDSSEVTRTGTFKAWIDKLSCKELFETEKASVKEYKNEYISVFGDPGEVVVSVINSDKYNYNTVSKKLDAYLKKQAKKSSISIMSSNKATISGFNQSIVDRQDTISNNAARLANQLTSLNNYKMEQPEGTNESGSKALLKKIIIVLAGLIFGALLGIAAVSFNVIRKGIVLSAEQIEDFFGIERIAQGSINDNKYPAVIDAVVNALYEDEKDIMVVSSEKDENYDSLVTKIDEKSSRGYTYSEIKEDDVEMLSNLSKIGGVITPVEIGRTTQKEIHDIIRWTQKFKKNMIGYIVLDS